jgi:hypothetical protein
VKHPFDQEAISMAIKTTVKNQGSRSFVNAQKQAYFDFDQAFQAAWDSMVERGLAEHHPDTIKGN